MKSLYIKIICLTMFAFGLISNAQGNVNFTIHSNSITSSGQTIDVESTITKIDNTLNWIQSDEEGSEQTSFSIVSTSGNWDQVNSTGELIYELDINGTQVILVITGTESSLMTKLTYILNNSQQQEYSFNINEINYL